MKRLLIGMIVLAGAATAESIAPWVILTGEEIQAGLEERELVYEGGARQTFYASGRTLYDSGRPSWGFWEVRGDEYCSQWPPADGWACYEVRQIGHDEFIFVGESGSKSVGVYTETD